MNYDSQSRRSGLLTRAQKRSSTFQCRVLGFSLGKVLTVENAQSRLWKVELRRASDFLRTLLSSSNQTVTICAARVGKVHLRPARKVRELQSLNHHEQSNSSNKSQLRRHHPWHRNSGAHRRSVALWKSHPARASQSTAHHSTQLRSTASDVRGFAQTIEIGV